MNNTIKTSFYAGFSIREPGQTLEQFGACEWYDDPFYLIRDQALFMSISSRSPLEKVKDLAPGTQVMDYAGEVVWFLL